MAYKITLTLLGGQTTHLQEIHHGPTPQKGAIISVPYPGGIAKAQVNGVRSFPPKGPPGTASVDQVDAQEM